MARRAAKQPLTVADRSIEEVLQQFLSPFPLMLVPPSNADIVVVVEDHPILNHVEEMIRQISSIEQTFDEVYRTNNLPLVIETLHQQGNQLMMQDHPMIHQVGRRLQAFSQDDVLKAQHQCLEEVFAQGRASPQCHQAMIQLIPHHYELETALFWLVGLAAFVLGAWTWTAFLEPKKKMEDDDQYYNFAYMESLQHQQRQKMLLTRRTVLTPHKVAYEGVPIQVV